ncbi:MAG: isopeptide-forming domain-containing fimbrial protein [Oscillospiraceae bacterium]|nr:isopeptide-forming domain-containing fimbrial protein [Oscillospiraceae bacterium]
MKKNKILASLLALALLMAAALPMSVHAGSNFPGSITVQKPEGFSIDGMTFTAYRIFNLSYSGSNYSYTLAPGMAGFLSFEGNSYTEATLIAAIEGMGPSGSASMDELAAQLYAYVTQTPTPPAVVSYSQIAGAGPGETSVTIDHSGAGLPLGYYMVFGSVKNTGEDGGGNPLSNTIVAACALTTTDDEGIVIPKVGVPEITKEVWFHGGSPTDAATPAPDGGGWQEWTDVSIGDTAYFKITTAVPQRRGYAAAQTSYQFIVHDVMSPGLTLNPGSIKVFLDGDYEEPLAAGVDYTVTTNVSTKAPEDETTITVTFTPSVFITYTTGDAIEITYSATLNERAVVAGAGNPNRVQLEYSTNPYWDGTGTGTGRTPWRWVRVYTYKLDIFKYSGELLVECDACGGTGTECDVCDGTGEVFGDEDEHYFARPGAQFKLCKNADGTSPIFFSNNGGGSYTVKKSGTTGEEVLESPESGLIHIDGLDAGTYYLIETAAPAGFNLNSAPVTVTIAKGDIDATTKIVSYTINGNTHVAANTKPGDVNIQNNSGSLLPGTGGIGTYVVLGACAIAAVLLAAAYVIYRKKRTLNALTAA